jgi:hypothetical protein
MSKPHWTKDRPKESGFYWYRENGFTGVIEWDELAKCVMTAGSDINLSDDSGYDIEGEFYSEKLTPPSHE